MPSSRACTSSQLGNGQKQRARHWAWKLSAISARAVASRTCLRLQPRGWLRSPQGIALRRTAIGHVRSAPGRWRCRPRRRRGCGFRRSRRIAGHTRSGHCGRNRRSSGSPFRQMSALGAAQSLVGASSVRGRSSFCPRAGRTRWGRGRCRCLPRTAESGPSPSTDWCRP